MSESCCHQFRGKACAEPYGPYSDDRELHIRENETITVGPVRVLGVEVHELVEQNVGHGGHAHRGTGMTGVGLGGGINLDVGCQ